jgi:ABC-type uncharacterized transport system permease subunit
VTLAVVPALWQIARLEAQTFLAYRFSLALQLFGLLLQVYLLKVVWTTVYAGRAEVDGVALGPLIAYLTLANLQVWVIYPEIAERLPPRIQTGAIALDLALPVSLLMQFVSRNVGATLGLLALVTLALPVAAILGSLAPPASVGAAALYLVSMAVGYGVTLAIGLLLGLLAFWTFRTQGITLLYHFVNQFFAGALVPLFFFPDWLRRVAELLPFQTQAFLPLSIYFGHLSGLDALRAIGIAIVWLALLWVAAAVVWRAAIRRVVIQGG